MIFWTGPRFFYSRVKLYPTDSDSGRGVETSRTGESDFRKGRVETFNLRRVVILDRVYSGGGDTDCLTPTLRPKLLVVTLWSVSVNWRNGIKGVVIFSLLSKDGSLVPDRRRWRCRGRSRLRPSRSGVSLRSRRTLVKNL